MFKKYMNSTNQNRRDVAQFDKFKQKYEAVQYADVWRMCREHDVALLV